MNTLIPNKESLGTIAFFDGDTFAEYKNQVTTSLTYVEHFLQNNKFYSGKSPEQLHNLHRRLGTFLETTDLNQALEDLRELFLEHTVGYHHKDYVAHLNCPVLLPALIGDLLATSLNTAIETWDQATSGVYIEQEVIRWAADRMGLTGDTDGVFTSGGTQSNFMALLMARDHYAYTHFDWKIKEQGWHESVSRYRIFCSEKAHFSIKKNAALLGMGYNAVIPVKTDDKHQMDIAELLLSIEREKQSGNIPIAVVATLGTTDFGSFDPLDVIAKITQEQKIWLHVDGAYGGCFALSEQFRHRFTGMECVDSMTVDFHKTLFQPLCASAFLLKNKAHFRYVSHYADYLNPLENRNDQTPDLVEKSIQTTRRFDALKVWFTLKVTGEKQLAAYLEQVHAIIVDTYEQLKNDPYLEFAHQPELSTLVFRYNTPFVKDETVHDKVNKFIRRSLFDSGQASVASTRVNGRIFLKITLLNPLSSVEHLVHIVQLIKRKGQEYQYSN